MFITNNLTKEFVEFYKCGSIKQMKFLIDEKNIMYVSHFISKRTGKKVWNFVKCEELNRALDEWRCRKNER